MRLISRLALIAIAGVAVLVPGSWEGMTPLHAQGGLAITSPAFDAVLAAGPDYASDIIGDAWDMSNAEDVAVDPAQRSGWSTFAFSSGRVGGTLATVNGASNGSNVALLERAYWGIINPGRTGAEFPIDSVTFTKLAFKMSSTRSDQFPRVYWFQRDLGDPAGIGDGWRYVDSSIPSPAGERIFVVNLTQSLGGGNAWTAAPVRGFSLYPNSSAVGYDVHFDWVRITTGDAHPAAARHVITWTGGTGTSTLEVIDGSGTVFTIASGVAGTSYDWNYGVLPPGSYTLRVTRGGNSTTTAFRINTPPTLKITDPDKTGGEDWATAVRGNAWDMNDSSDVLTVAEDHLLSKTFSGGQMHGTSDGETVAFSGSVPVGDPIVYLQTNGTLINTSRYRYLTYRLQVDGNYDLMRGSVARLFWGSVNNQPYNVTVTKDIITWSGMNTFTVDLASLSTSPTGGIVTTEGAATPWTTSNVRYLRLDPHEFAEVRGFHIDEVRLTAMDAAAAGQFTIRFTGSDADGDSSTVALFYDTNRNTADGYTAIASSIPLSSGEYQWNTGGVPVGTYYIYAVVSDGRNAFGTYSTGPVAITESTPLSNPLMSLDVPANGSSGTQPLLVSGWAIDRGASAGTGVNVVHVYAYPNPGSGQAPFFLGSAAYGGSRPDVGTAFGSQFTNSAFSLTVDFLPPGPYLFAVYARSTVTGQNQVRTSSVTINGGPLLSVDQPASGSNIAQPFLLEGWATDMSAPSGSGVDAIHVWAYPNPGSGTPPVFVGVAQYGVSRADVGAAYGSRFTPSGYRLEVKGLAPGPYQLVVFARSTATGTFNRSRSVFLTIDNSTLMSIDTPGNGAVNQPFMLGGWAIDRAAAAGTGVDTVHVWAYPNPGSGTPAQFLGVATYGAQRSDLASIFGAQFGPSGYNLSISGLSSGVYDLVAFAHSTVSNEFDNWRVVRVTVP